ncbi:hypothetical protein [Ferrimonas sp.]|uniref:hypothetical protein n=1 Tax=Ferrimonas sp. TaxID=2080861 RepID=UPI003A947484
MTRCSVPMMLILLLTLVCQGAVARIHLMAPPSGEQHGHGHHVAMEQSEADCHPVPCHGVEHYCEGECGHCQILIPPTSLVTSQGVMAVARHSPPLAPPLMHVDSCPPERALRPPIG